MSTKCILQVEDDPNDVFLLKRVFEQAGIKSPLHTVTDGQMAVDYLRGRLNLLIAKNIHCHVWF